MSDLFMFRPPETAFQPLHSHNHVSFGLLRPGPGATMCVDPQSFSHGV